MNKTFKIVRFEHRKREKILIFLLFGNTGS